MGSRLYKIRGPKPYTYLEEGGVPHLLQDGEASEEVVSQTDAAPVKGPLEQCEMCETQISWIHRASPKDHEFGLLGKCRPCDWHLCAVCLAQGARCTRVEHFENPMVAPLSCDYGDGFSSLSGSIEAGAGLI